MGIVLKTPLNGLAKGNEQSCLKKSYSWWELSESLGPIKGAEKVVKW